jgi:hypothetical protein
MSTHLRAFHAAGAPAVTRLCTFGALVILLALDLILAGCADTPRSPVAGPDPADPGARAPRVDYRSTIGSYKSQRPVSPGPWREQNEQVTPAPKSGQ